MKEDVMGSQWTEGKPQKPGVYWMRQDKGVVLCFVAPSPQSPESAITARLIPGRLNFSVYNACSLEDFECLEYQDIGSAMGLEYDAMTQTWVPS